MPSEKQIYPYFFFHPYLFFKNTSLKSNYIENFVRYYLLLLSKKYNTILFLFQTFYFFVKHFYMFDFIFSSFLFYIYIYFKIELFSLSNYMLSSRINNLANYVKNELPKKYIELFCNST